MSLFKVTPKKAISTGAFFSSSEGAEFINQRAFREIKKHFSVIQPNTSYHLVSAGSWSLFELIIFITKQIGPCELYLTTWAISEDAALAFAELFEKNVYTKVYGVFDHTTESHKNSALTVCRSFFTKIEFAHLHAKVTVLKNEKWSISIVSTANMTTNPRYERTVVFTSPEVAQGDLLWINHLLHQK
jgi:hypothetical protein